MVKKTGYWLRHKSGAIYMRKKRALGRILLSAVLSAVIVFSFAADSLYGASATEEISEREIRNAELSMRAAAQGMVLLENKNQTLPIASSGNIALFGGGAVNTIKGGTGSGDVNQRYAVSVWDGFKKAGYNITSSSWLYSYEECFDKARAEANLDWWKNFTMDDPGLVADDIEKAKEETDTAVYVISRGEGEGTDRKAVKGDYYLSETERKNLTLISKNFDKTIVVLNTGSVIDTSFFDEIDGLDALLLMSQAGMEGGSALVRVLNGDITPSGKLTDTWARNYDDYPSSETFGANDGNTDQEEYTEGIYVGYRYFDTFDVTPSFPFGYGLSYTTFDVEAADVQVSDGNVTVTVKVTNTGSACSGKEVVEIYFSAPEGELDKPYQELAAYGKTDELKPGERQKLKITFPVSDMASYSEKKAAYVMEKGSYIIRVGDSSRNTHVAAVVRLSDDTVTEQLSSQKKPDHKIRELSSKDSRAAYSYEGEEDEISSARLIELTPEDIPAQNHASVYDDESVTAYVSDTTQRQYLSENLGYTPHTRYHGDYSENVVTLEGDFSRANLKDVYDGKITMEEFVSALTVSQMADIVIGGSKLPNASGQSLGASSDNTDLTDAGTIALAQKNSVQGSAGETVGLYIISKKIPNVSMADGPAGLRLTQEYTGDDGKDYYQYCTAWPIGTLLASTWDTNLIGEVGKAFGAEAAEFGVTTVLAPGMNIHRNPLCGRNFEYYSEDPTVSGLSGAAETAGIQSNPGIGACIKHFAANNQEANRTAVNNTISERAFREIYLRGFEIAVRSAQPTGVMSSYNLNNGVPAGDDYDLLTDILRGEWGFDGFVVTDWGGGKSDPAVSMHAGNDLIMPGSSVEDITVRAFGDEEPSFASDNLYPEVVISENRGRLKEQTRWGEFIPSADGDEVIEKTVDTNTYENAVRDGIDENGDQTEYKVKDLIEKLGSAATVKDNEDGTTTVTYRGFWADNNITLGDLQKSTIRVLTYIMNSARFADMFDDVEPEDWTEMHKDELISYCEVQNSDVY